MNIEKQSEVNSRSSILTWMEQRKYIGKVRLMEMEGIEMTEKEQMTLLIEEYSKLQRILKSADRDEELQYQLKITRAKLEALGVVVENLEK